MEYLDPGYSKTFRQEPHEGGDHLLVLQLMVLVKLGEIVPEVSGRHMWFAGSPDFVISIAMLIFVLHHFQNLRRKFQTTFWIEGCHSNDCMGYDQELRRFCTKKLRILYIKWQITNVSLDMNM